MPVLSESARKTYESKLAAAEEDYRKDSSNADAIIWLGRRWAYLGKYQKAIAIFTRGVNLHPKDARMYRHRGHRYLTLRCFDKAIEDFKKAAKLVKSKPDETEPDGLPNEKNIPTSTLQSNIWYHLGLTYFLKGEYRKALKAYKVCLRLSTNPDMYIATFNWAYLTNLKLGNFKKAKKLYYSVDRNGEIIENFDYLRLYYNLYTDKPYEKDIEYVANLMMKDAGPLSIATMNFATGFYCLSKGYLEKAEEYFSKAIATNQWSSFGYIAAEAELNRMKK